MTWFKVDDGLHSHKKAVRAGIPAMGLWVMAGSWCADQLTNGWLPDYIAMRLDPDYEQHAKALVQVGLWVEETRDEEPGWAFHEWNEPGRQPTKDQVLADRAAAADRQKRARDRAREHRDRGSRQESQDDSPDRHAVTPSVTVAVTHGDVTGVVTVPPSRPDPSRPSLPKGRAVSPDGEQPGFPGMPVAEKAPPEKSPARKTRKPKRETTPEEDAENQLVNKLAKVYTDKVKLSDFMVVRGIVVAARTSGFDEQAISAGLKKLAEEDDPISKEILRRAIKGDPSWAKRNLNSNEQFQNPTNQDVYDNEWEELKR